MAHHNVKILFITYEQLCIKNLHGQQTARKYIKTFVKRKKLELDTSLNTLSQKLDDFFDDLYGVNDLFDN